MTKNPREAAQFATRKKATEAAISIGWTRGDVADFDVMGFRLWCVCDSHMNLLTYQEIAALCSERGKAMASPLDARIADLERQTADMTRRPSKLPLILAECERMGRISADLRGGGR